MIVASIPSPQSPLIFQLGPFALHWYGALIAVGVLLATWLTRRELQRRGLDPDAVYTIAVWCVPAGIIGARLYHVATDYELFRGHLERIPQIWTGGLGLPGVIAGGALGAYVGARRAGLVPLVVFDCLAPGLIAAQAIGRWGNYANQELFGRPSDLPWAVEIDPAHRPAQYAHVATFQPTFLYESLWNLAVLGLLLWLAPRVWDVVKPGTLFLVYLATYSAGRLVTESLRSDFAHTILGLRVNQWLFGVVLVVAGPIAAQRLYAVRRRARRDWVAWHARYDTDPGLAERLVIVRARIREALDQCPAGPIRVVSICAGDGRDLIGALDGHPRRDDVRARLVEAEPALVDRGRAAAAAAHLTGVEFVCGDASRTSAFVGAVPADLVLVCGVFGNLRDGDIAGTVESLETFCAPGARVIWTRHRRAPDRTPWIRERFAAAGFSEVAFDPIPASTATVGVHRIDRPARPLEPDRALFASA